MDKETWEKFVDGLPTPSKTKLLFEIHKSIKEPMIDNMDEIKDYLKKLPIWEEKGE